MNFIRRINVKPQRIALIGPDQQENLALQYLAAAVEADGHCADLVAYNSPRDLERCVSTVLNSDYDLVGMTIAFQYAVEDYIRLAQLLRQRGYGGHITCGGHVPTFCYSELLKDAPEIDTVVRHDGEQTLVEMLDRMSRGEALCGIAGLVWHDGACIVPGPIRPPIRDLDTIAFPKRRNPPLTVGGVRLGFVITSRGCIGECAYCSIRAFASDAGNVRYRIRRVDKVADEIAVLYHENGIRLFCVQDDLFVLPNEGKAVSRMNELTKALRERSVHRVALWIKGRPECITEPILQAASEMGAIHLFLGVESASLERLRYLGRTHTSEDNRRAIALCRRYRVKPSFNFMLFDPECSLSDIEATVNFAAENLGLPWNICRTEVYSGTQLLQRLKDQGRLQGDYKSYGYTMSDTAAEVLFRIMRVSFHRRSFAAGSLMNRLISLSFARQVHEVFFPGEATDTSNQKVDALLIEVQRDAIDEIRYCIDYVSEVDLQDAEKIRDFAIERTLDINNRDLQWYNRYEQLWDELNVRGDALFEAGQMQKP